MQWSYIGMAIPRRFSLLEESRNGKLPFLESIPRGPWGISRNGMLVQFILLIFQDFFLFLLLSFGIITENTNLWCKNSMMIKTIPIFRGICFLSFFLWNFSRKCCTIWKVLEAFCRGPEDPRSDRIYSSRNRGVKKDLGPGTLKSKTAAVKLKSLPPQQATHR